LPMTALAGSTVGAITKEKIPGHKPDTPPPAQARGGDYFPNIAVHSHTGEQFMFYDDLVKNRVVLINFMSIREHAAFPATTHLARIADKLGEQLGRDVFIYSVSTDPGRDTAERLKKFAKQNGAMRKGWHFLSTKKESVESVSYRLYKHKGHVGHSKGHPSRLVHYGNGGVGIWAAFGVDSEPGFAASRVSWVKNGTENTGVLRRAGPRRLSESVIGHNRMT